MTPRHVSCCVPFCRNKSEVSGQSEISFHCIPKDENLRKEWLAEIRRTEGVQDFRITENTRVCSAHFKLEDFRLHQQSTKRLLKETALPSVFLWNSGKLVTPQPSHVSSTSKAIRLKKLTFDEECSLVSKEVQTVDSITFKDESCQANLARNPLCDPALIGEYSQCRDHFLPDLFRAAIICVHKFTDLTFSFHLWQEGLPTYMEITRVGWYGTPCLGQVPAKMTMSSGGQMHFAVLCMQPVICNVLEENGNFNEKYFSEFLLKLSKSSRNMWCSGLPLEGSAKRGPWARNQAKKCEVYFKATQNASNNALAAGIGRCAACRRKKRSMAACARKLTPSSIEKRVQNGSKCPIAFLSPDSKIKRLENYRRTESELKETLASLKVQLLKFEGQDGTCNSKNVSGAGDLDLDCTNDVHSRENSFDSGNSDWTDENDADNTNDQQRCKICERTFKQKLSLQRHLKIHQSNELSELNNNGSACDMGSVKRRVHSDCLGHHQVKIDVLLGIASMLM